MHNSEDPESTQQVENVDHNNERVHLVLLHIQVGVVHHFDILLLVVAIVVVLQNSFDVVVVCLLREVKLKHETDNDGGVCAD